MYIHLSELAWCWFGLHTSHMGPVGGGCRLRALEVERTLPTVPLPKPGGSKTPLRQPRLQPGLGLRTLASQGWLWSEFWLLQALPAAPGLARPRGPPELGPSTPPNKRMWSQQRPRGAGSLLPGYPPGPSPTLSKGADPREPSPGEPACQADGEGREGGAGHFGISKADT